MDFTRRDMLAFGAAAGAAGWLPSAAAAQAGDGPFAAVPARLAAFAEAVLAQNGFPGMALALVGPGGWSAAFAIGQAGPDRRPASADHLFQIGSITKSLTAMAVFALAGRGRLDLAARVQDLLPDLPLPPEPIAVGHLLEHSSGLPNSLDATGFLDVPGGRLWTGFAPGSHYSYCNLGFALLGAIVERAAGLAFPRALEALVLRPIGMAGARPSIRMADRAQFAAGHARLREDVPWLPGAPLAPARWIEFDSAAGCVAARARDMVPFLRQLVALGRGRGAPLFADELALRYRMPTIAADLPGARYGNGLMHLDVGGRPCLRHTGGMIGFSSAITVDPQSGIGAFASVNVGGAGIWRPVEVTEYGLALLRAAAAGEPLPEVPAPAGPPPVQGPARFIGRWLAADGAELAVRARPDGLEVVSGGVARPLVGAGPNAAVTDHPALAPWFLAFDPGETLLRLGDRLFGRDAAPPARPAPPALAALAGAYHNPAGWSGAPLNIFAVGDRLALGATGLVPAPDGSWRFLDPAGVSERLWFQNPAAGRPRHLNLSGAIYTRLTEA